MFWAFLPNLNNPKPHRTSLLDSRMCSSGNFGLLGLVPGLGGIRPALNKSGFRFRVHCAERQKPPGVEAVHVPELPFQGCDFGRSSRRRRVMILARRASHSRVKRSPSSRTPRALLAQSLALPACHANVSHCLWVRRPPAFFGVYKASRCPGLGCRAPGAEGCW